MIDIDAWIREHKFTSSAANNGLQVLPEKAVRALLATLQPEPALSNLALPAEGAYIIHYDDADRPIELFAEVGARDAALRRYEQISDAWSATLFVKIKANTIDGRRIPDAALSQGDDAVLDILATARDEIIGECHAGWANAIQAGIDEIAALRAYVATLTKGEK